MRKFKLIKTYPGSPETLGLEVFQNGQWYESNFATKNVEHFHKPLNMVENFPEFWSEIFEPKFQILRISNGFNEYWRTPSNGKFTVNLTKFYDDKEFIKKGNLINGFEITSVKRLSDNAIFCLNDIVKSKSNLHKQTYKVDRIELVDNEIHLIPSNKEAYMSYSLSAYLPFELMDKVDEIKAFFTTEDGIEIFPGDSVYYVLSNFSKRRFTPVSDEINLEDIHYFSSEEKADEYIEFHKPKYSMEYIKEALKPHLGVFQHFQFYTEKIKKI